MSRNVLLITYYWPPSGGAGVQRMLKFAKYLPRFKVKPYILTVSNPTYPVYDESLKEDIPPEAAIYTSKSLEPFQLYGFLAGKTKQDVAQPTTALKQTKSLSAKAARWVRGNLFIPDARAGWLLTARKKALDLVQQYGIEAVITSGPPHSVHFAGSYLKKKAGVRWIADFRDPWTRIHYNQVLPRTSIAKNIDLKLERSILQKADEVLVVSPAMANIQEQIQNRSYQVIPNGFDPDDFRVISQEKSTSTSPKLTIRHVGSVSENSVPGGFFRALAEMGVKNSLNVEFVGSIHTGVMEQVSAFGLEAIVTHVPYLPHDEAIAKMQSADMLLLSIPKVENNELILTGKLFDYLAARKPILLLGPEKGDAAKIINELQAGTATGHGEITKIKTILAKAIQKYPEPLHKIPKFSLDDHPYSRIQTAKKLSELL